MVASRWHNAFEAERAPGPHDHLTSEGQSGEINVAVATSREGHRSPISVREGEVLLNKIASLHCGLMMSKGNGRTNGISDRESNSQPNCKDHRDLGHTLAHPTAQLLLKQSADDG